MFIACESIDESLEVTKVVDAINGDLPEHDVLFNDISADVDETEDKEVSDADEADELDEPAPEGSHATEDSNSLRATETDATESFKETLSSAASSIYSGVKTLASFGGNVVLWSGAQAKELGIAYGPSILSTLKTGTVKVCGSIFNLLIKFRVGLVNAVRRYIYSVRRMKSKHAALLASLDKLDAADTTQVNPESVVSSAKITRACYIGGETNPLKAALAMANFVAEVFPDVDKATEADVRTIELLIENTSRGVRFSPIPYLETHIRPASFTKRNVEGFAVDNEIQETYAYNKALPNFCLPVIGIPRADLVKTAAINKDISQITRAYHGSFMVLAVAAVNSESTSNLHYMDKQELRKLLVSLGKTINLLETHLSIFKSNARRSERLKLSYGHYLHWLGASEEQKSLKQELTDVIHLKQHFVTRVYLPAMMDLYDFSANHTLTLLSYVQQSIKKIKVNKT